MGPSTWPRVAQVVALIEMILADGTRPEVVDLLARISGHSPLIIERAWCMRSEPLVASPDVLTPKQAAEDLKLNPETVRVLCRRGELGFIRIGRSLRITRHALEQFKRDRG